MNALIKRSTLVQTHTRVSWSSGIATGGNGWVWTPQLRFRPLLRFAQIEICASWKAFCWFRGGVPCMYKLYMVTLYCSPGKNIFLDPPNFFGLATPPSQRYIIFKNNLIILNLRRRSCSLIPYIPYTLPLIVKTIIKYIVFMRSGRWGGRCGRRGVSVGWLAGYKRSSTY